MKQRTGSGKRRVVAVLAATAVIIAGLGFALNTVEAASSVIPRSGPSGKVVYGTYKGATQKLQTMLFQVDLNGQPSFMFCIDISTYIEFGVSYDESSWDTSKVPNLDKIARILSQTNAISTKDPVEIAAAQSAIWHFSDGFELDLTNPKNDPAVVTRYQALVGDATANPVSNEPTGTLSVSPTTATVAQGQPVFYDVTTTATAPLSIELSDAAATAHPATGTVCDVATTITSLTGSSRICVTSASTRTGVKMTLRTAAASLSAGRVFIRPQRQKLIIGKSGQAQSAETVSASWTANGRPTVSVACPTDGITYGEPVQLRAGATDPDGDRLTYQWSLNGQAIPGATSADIEISLAATDRLAVAVTDAAGQTASADVICPGKNPPVVTLNCPTDLTLGAENTFTATGIDPDGDAVTYQWTFNGELVSNTTGATFTTKVVAGDVVEVSAVDATSLVSAPAVSTCIPPKQNRPPTVELTCPTALMYGTPTEFTATGTDPDGDPLTYEWKVDGTVVAGQTGPTATLTVTKGQKVSVTVTDGTATSAPAEKTCEGDTPNQPPTVKLTCPKGLVYGTPTEFTATGTDPDGNPLTYEWKVDGTVVAGQTGPTATLTVTKGQKVSVTVTDGRATSAPAEKTCEGTEPNDPPTVTLTCPTDLVYGEPTKLTATGADPDGDALTYEWKVNGKVVSGASGATTTLTLRAGDQVTVTAKDARGATSAATTIGCVGNTVPTVELTCPTQVLYGEATEFTAVGADADQESLTYVWSLNGTRIEGQTGATATIAVHAGDRVNVAAVDPRGAASASVTVQCAGNSRPTVTITCPSKLVFGEPADFIANGIDPDGDTDLFYTWYLNGVPVAGEHGPKLTTSLTAADQLTVSVTDSRSTSSTLAAADCDGNRRPTLSMTCPTDLVFGTPATFTATADDDGDTLTYEWRVGDAVVQGATGPTATLTLRRGDRVSVTATDAEGLTSAVATSTCAGDSAPKVAVTCPATLVYGEAATFTATGTDDDGDTLTYRWTIDGVVVAGSTGPTAQLVVPKGAKVGVTATDPTGLASAETVFDCTGRERPRIAIACPTNFAFGTPVTFTATSDTDDVAKLLFTWSLNGKVVPGVTASNTATLQPNDVLGVTAVDATGIVASTVGTTCTGPTPPTPPTPVPPTPTILGEKVVRAATQSTRASFESLPVTGGEAGAMALVALGALVAGLGLVGLSRRRARRHGTPDDLTPNV